MTNKKVPVTLYDEETVTSSVVMFEDRQTIQSARILRDSGEMIAPVTIARTGVMPYMAKELGPDFADLPPNQVVRVMTPPEVLFDSATIELCRSAPVTVGHPKEDVSLANNKELQKGFIEGLPLADGSHLSGFIVLNDEATIKLVDSGVDQTSWGHSAVVERRAGEGYDAIKTKITAVNHLAIVQRGRAQTTRIGDSGEEVVFVDQALFDTVEAERDSALSKVATLEQKLADSEKAKLSDEAIQAIVDERVKARSELLLSVCKLGDEFAAMDFTGKSEKEIKREVVSKLHDADLSAKSDDYIDVRFEIALEDCDTVGLSDALSASILKSHEAEENAKKPNAREEAIARREQRYNK
ncbi:TPA: DUF2213 domain-containing protein [Escherichia coli]|nr:DUF2213 domain-containing protein [Escherichia coli]